MRNSCLQFMPKEFTKQGIVKTMDFQCLHLRSTSIWISQSALLIAKTAYLLIASEDSMQLHLSLRL